MTKGATMTMNDDEVRQQLAQLWSSNMLNIRRATMEAQAQGRTRLDVAFELVDIVFAPNGEFLPYAKDCLAYLGSRNVFSLYLWTMADHETSTRLNITKLAPLGVTIKGHNENPFRRNVAWDARKPWFDIVIDRTSGFDVQNGLWFWAMGLFRTAADVLAEGLSGTRIIQKLPALETAPVTGLIRRKLL